MKILRNILFIAINLALFLNFLNISLIKVTFLLGLSLFVFFIGSRCIAQKKYNKLFFWPTLFLIISTFSIYKIDIIRSTFLYKINDLFLQIPDELIGEIVYPLPSIHFLLGFSYFSIKIIQFLVDCYKSRILELKLTHYLNYLFFFPTFTAGPIDRYSNFSKNLENPITIDFACILKASQRIFWGSFKILVIAETLFHFSIGNVQQFDSINTSQAWLGLFLYSFYIYFDFSGYSDIAIGIGLLFGIKVPENFNSPYLCRNITSFWQNWHITLSHFLRDYLFNPLSKQLILRTKGKTNNLCQLISNLITMIVCGLWHGAHLNFIAWGIWHGLGLSGFKILNGIFNQYAPEGIIQWSNSTTSGRFLGIALNFVFVSLGWVFFTMDYSKSILAFKTLFCI
jgi:alginate O-acetyltransferase complex protein AlgI